MIIGIPILNLIFGFTALLVGSMIYYGVIWIIFKLVLFILRRVLWKEN
jgi:hypothetical protein